MLYAADGLVQSHAGVAAALRDPRLVVARTGGWIAHASLPRRRLQPLRHLMSKVLVFQEGGQHAALKAALGPALLMPRLQALRPTLLTWARQWLRLAGRPAQGHGHHSIEDHADGHGLVSGLPRASLELLLGTELPSAIRTQPIARLLRAQQPDAALLLEAQDAALGLMAWADEALHSRAMMPPWLIGLPPEDQTRCLCLLAFAGTETSQHLLAGLLDRWLHASDAERDAMAAGPEAAIREQLRWQSPIQYTVRRVAKAGVWEHQSLAVGQSLLLHLGRAQRDPMVFAHPQQFQPARTEGPGLGLGLGLHACLGAALARFQAEVLLQALAMPEGRAWRAPQDATAFVALPFDESTGLVCRPKALPMVVGDRPCS